MKKYTTMYFEPTKRKKKVFHFSFETKKYLNYDEFFSSGEKE